MRKIRVAAAETDSSLEQIFGLLRKSHALDFHHYKRPTIFRRIARRMSLMRTESLPDYLNVLRTNKDELEALYEDLLITVTAFFRDPSVFEFLKSRIIPAILDRTPEFVPARVWVPGCASGEEAYSIAICFLEVAQERKGPPVQIFATDISEQCIAKARHGIYPEHIKANVSPERLSRFFTRETDGYHIRKDIRQMCIFAEQDVISDAPFSQIDLVSCRNLLIYLNTPTQKEVLIRLHFALKPNGFLLLGPSETILAAPELFEELEKSERIYCKVPTVQPIHFAPNPVRYLDVKLPEPRPVKSRFR